MTGKFNLSLPNSEIVVKDIGSYFILPGNTDPFNTTCKFIELWSSSSGSSSSKSDMYFKIQIRVFQNTSLAQEVWKSPDVVQWP